MAEFEVKIKKIEVVEPHPNADRLDLVGIGDYRCIIPKGQHQVGDLVVYIPEAAVCPDWLIEEMGLTGRLAGKQHNRVKAVKLRGILSQGLVYPTTQPPNPSIGNDNYVQHCIERNGKFIEVREGQDVTEFLGITKYEPPIPVHMAGEVFNAHGYTLGYDIENIKKYPDVFQDEEEVVMTEKIHGTWCCFGYHPDVNCCHIITSKGLSGKGLAFKVNEANKNNLYIRALDNTAPYPDGTGGTVIDRAIEVFGPTRPVYILGEVYGKGVQDLTYGADKPEFRVFDIYLGEPGKGEYLGASSLHLVCKSINANEVPIIYTGPFSKEKMEQATNGKEVVSGKETNIREGVVIKPLLERRDLELGRVILKSVSEKYLLRKGDVTEFN